MKCQIDYVFSTQKFYEQHWNTKWNFVKFPQTISSFPWYLIAHEYKPCTNLFNINYRFRSMARYKK